MKFVSAFAFLALLSTACAADQRNTLCVKQKNGTYRCKASGKIQKEPCCDTPSNYPTPKPKK